MRISSTRPREVRVWLAHVAGVEAAVADGEAVELPGAATHRPHLQGARLQPGATTSKPSAWISLDDLLRLLVPEALDLVSARTAPDR